MKRRNKLIALMFAAVLLATPTVTAFADAAPDGKTVASGSAFEAWKSSNWDQIKTDWTCVSLTPGADETEMNFAWYSKDGESVSLKYGQQADLSDAQEVEISQKSTGQTDRNGICYTSNKAVITGLAADTIYYYQVEGKEIESFTTGNTSSFTFAFVGDPQIGSSNDMKAKKPENITEEFYQVQDESVASDSYNWANTLQQALAKCPDLDFVVSAGDQIQTNAEKVADTTISEIEYVGYLSPAALTSLPVATTVGNHDADNANYQYHFNVPNLSTLGDNGVVGGDYYFRYGDVLFLMLNTQDTNSAEHIQFIKDTVEKNQDCTWKIVTLHQDIYGSAEHSNEPEIVNLRYALTPAFEKYGIDAVLTGHDHAYSRSKFLNGDEAEQTVTYTDDEFDEMLDVDLDNGDSEETLTVAPGNIADDTTDPLEQAYLAYLHDIMDESRITEDDTTYAVNPEGILYLTASSSSGSKYYDLVPRMQSYIESRWQEDVPTYTLVDVTETTMTINTYRTDTNEKIDESVTVVKTTDTEALALKIAEIGAADLDEAAYTPDSWKALTEALSAANAVLADKTATEAEVSEALANLTEAYDGLVKVQNTGDTDDADDPDKSGDAAQTPGQSDGSQSGNDADLTNGAGTDKPATDKDAGTNTGKSQSGTKSTSKVKTSDNSQAGVFTGICIAGMAGMGAMIYYRKRLAVKREK